ncbi:MAG: hypothetical protein CMH57_13320 [Myxococcales bacterium]|nr:hypothetical protein [Myxococcales bacterium]
MTTVTVATMVAMMAMTSAVSAEPNLRVSNYAARQAAAQPLSRAELSLGFRGITRSAEKCLVRHRKERGSFPLDSVRVEVTVNPSGQVSKVIVPRQVRWSEFGRCMKAHAALWQFPTFKGRPIQVAKSFRVEEPEED